MSTGILANQKSPLKKIGQSETAGAFSLSRYVVCNKYKVVPLEGQVEAEEEAAAAGGRIPESQGQRCRPRRPDAFVGQWVLDAGPALHNAALARGRWMRSRKLACVWGGGWRGVYSLVAVACHMMRRCDMIGDCPSSSRRITCLCVNTYLTNRKIDT